jgi:membrane carboxypeptidase/penicillin-binding protein
MARNSGKEVKKQLLNKIELREGRERRQAKQSDASGSQQAEAGAEPQRSSSSASSSSRATRGPDHLQRSRESHMVRDHGDNSENPNDWANFDIGRVVWLFRTDRESSITLSLRKLYIRRMCQSTQ